MSLFETVEFRLGARSKACKVVMMHKIINDGDNDDYQTNLLISIKF